MRRNMSAAGVWFGLFRETFFVFVFGSDAFSWNFGLGELRDRAADVALLARRQVIGSDEFVVVYICIDDVPTLAYDRTGDRKCERQSVNG